MAAFLCCCAAAIGFGAKTSVQMATLRWSGGGEFRSWRWEKLDEREVETVDGAPTVQNPFDAPLHAGLTGTVTLENADVRGELDFVPEE